jgi:surface protein
MSAQTAKAEQTYYLYAKISNSAPTAMTLVCATSMPSESGYTFTKYDGNGAYWNDDFNGTVLSITTDVSCRNYDGSSLGYFIYNFKELTSVDVSNLNTANVTNMECMFCYCPKLTTINFGDGTYFKTDNVETMRSMFSDSKALTSLDLSGWNTAKVTTMKEMFSICQDLTTLRFYGKEKQEKRERTDGTCHKL